MRRLEIRNSLSLIALLAFGCGSPQLVVYDHPSIPYVVCVARPAVLEAPEPPVRKGVVRVDMEVLTRDLVKVLRDLDVCTRVEEVRTADEREALSVARRLGADLLIVIEAESWPRYRLSGHSGWYIPNIGLWFLVGLPSWWIHDCIYEVKWAADFGLVSVPSGEVLTGGIRSMRSEEALSVAERGWTWRALLTPPAYYEGPDEGVALTPLAEDLIIGQVLTLIQDAPPGDEAVAIEISPAGRGIASGAADIVRYTLPLRITVRSDRELERFTVELDGRQVPELNHNRLTLPEPTIRTLASGREFVYAFVLTERDLASYARKDAHYLRILARGIDPSRSSELWSTSRTVKLERPQPEEGLATTK